METAQDSFNYSMDGGLTWSDGVLTATRQSTPRWRGKRGRIIPGELALLVDDAATVLALEPDQSALKRLAKVGVVGAHPPGSETRATPRRATSGPKTSTDARITSRGWYFGNVIVDPVNPDVVYAPNVALYRSTDGGKNFTVLPYAENCTSVEIGHAYNYTWVGKLYFLIDRNATLSDVAVVPVTNTSINGPNGSGFWAQGPRRSPTKRSFTRAGTTTAGWRRRTSTIGTAR